MNNYNPESRNDHKFTTIKKLDEISAVERNKASQTEGANHQAVVDIVSDDTWKVNENEVSKIVDENGEPKVVYHGTGTEGIEGFYLKKAQDKTGRKLGFGLGKGKFYLTD